MYLYFSIFICICICQCLGRAVPGSHKVSPPTAVEGHCRLFLVVHLDAPTNHPPAPPHTDMENVAYMANMYVQNFVLVVHFDAPVTPTPDMEKVANIYVQNWRIRVKNVLSCLGLLGTSFVF